MEDTKLRGVNLGGWLVLEKWMTPSLFEGLEANDETNFCNELGEAKYERLKAHRDSFIQKSDFTWLSIQGVNAVRIPVGHWILDGQAPYVAAAEYLDTAMDWADEIGLKVIIDLHAAPGSQNGWDHSGKAGEILWHTKEENIVRSLDIVGQLAERYAGRPSLYGIELLNEPHWTVPIETLVGYYQEGYRRVREHCGNTVAVIISDAFRPLQEWVDVMNKPDFVNVVLDTHLYQAFDKKYAHMKLEEHIQSSAEWRENIEQFTANKPLIVGEWSLGLASKTYEHTDPKERDRAHRAYGMSQLMAFEAASGNFFWNYKAEAEDEWNFRYCYDNWLSVSYP
jgi:glucan 1,3-beta-glucosidase